MSLQSRPLQRFRLWLARLIAGPLIRQEAQRAFLDGNEAGYRLGLTDGMAIEAEDQTRREQERGPEATPEPHDACIALLGPLNFNHPDMPPLPTPQQMAQDMAEAFGVPARLINAQKQGALEAINRAMATKGIPPADEVPGK